MKHVAAPPTQDVPPWHYRLGKWLGRYGVRGSGLLIRIPDRLGMLHRVVRFPVRGEYTIDVPLYRRANQWDAQQVREYEGAFLDTFAAEINRFDAPVSFIDCGADIGLFSVGLIARSPKIDQVIAFEPDRAACEILARNLARLPIATQARSEGVAESAGRARLASVGNSEHAAYLAPAESGDVPVVSLDALLEEHADLSARNLALKIDVEGGELAVLRGAERLLRGVPRFAVGFEAHRDVMARTGIDPIECARWLSRLRPCRWVVSELPDLRLNLDRGFFEQARLPICNVIGISVEAAHAS